VVAATVEIVDFVAYLRSCYSSDSQLSLNRFLSL